MEWFSVRMRAAAGGSHEQGGSHISGGERLVPVDAVESMVQSLVRRAMTHELGRPDFVNVTVEVVPAEAVRSLPALPISKREAESVEQGHAVAVEILGELGISREVAELAVCSIAEGPAPNGGAMRGAIVMDADTGQRLESDSARGVRVAKIDWHPEELQAWYEDVRSIGIASERIAEALALATKVTHTPGTVAELCWSDDPGYVSGYVASAELGYVRIPILKEWGSPLGGRVFFVRGISSVEDYEEALQAPVLLRREENKR
ncbi:6-carboxyhexanoate--CoA ligase [Tumebacillus sp. ITR2]|uniref:6-carboxyhexanoate--CoA ligase n=1 Tax=Tumebacillus amylolyticus TaxID=2801339 RepID=A0ABS1J7A2_9BACL|nr:6-carboxyhexanoate--CoA ligase [Tumebacillus amylolyticus]